MLREQRQAWKDRKARESTGTAARAGIMVDNHRGNARAALKEARRRRDEAKLPEVRDMWKEIAEFIEQSYID